ncbi:nitrate reductase cytochrome c-type subunit [Jiella marina]|uniref:nitrate reductase cytochrome c-type subunit n=1 Tax=Jiella sp. LLJ827 TaxID=2917712 RepID=UPI002101539B|nr:nitrate reductase cytochrome c-type subunit [Jiella sp. LLJ827]MCQ0988822.1 nitrate reductase cytochrome c-type subunit [Jiella sp. LLJ827]
MRCQAGEGLRRFAVKHCLAPAFAFAATAFLFGAALAQPVSLRGPTSPADNAEPPPMANFEEGAGRKVRNYPEQPPIIPHDVTGYRIDLNSNKCLSCHARARVGESGAPMVSITHFMDRDGQFRAAVTPRRYFCTQCHVSQQEVTPLVENDFVDLDDLIHPKNASGQR